MTTQEPGNHAITLVRLVGETAAAAQVADAIVTVWNAIDAALNPIIGHGGVAALYGRSLHLTGAAHSWLAGEHLDRHNAMDLQGLRSLFAQQSSADAIAGGDALLQTFHELLATLIGPSLSERLLRPVRVDLSRSVPEQDTSQ